MKLRRYCFSNASKIPFSCLKFSDVKNKTLKRPAKYCNNRSPSVDQPFLMVLSFTDVEPKQQFACEFVGETLDELKCAVRYQYTLSTRQISNCFTFGKVLVWKQASECIESMYAFKLSENHDWKLIFIRMQGASLP